MKINLVFQDWEKNGKSVYSSEEGIELSLRDFHSGSTFSSEIELTPEQEEEFELSIKNGYTPVFYAIK